MPTPRTLTTASHADFELEVVSGAWPADLSGEVVFSSPQNSGTLPYAIFDWGTICRLSINGPSFRSCCPSSSIPSG